MAGPALNLEIKNFPKWWPWLPFSQARIISDENIWMYSPLQFHFQYIFGYELKTVICSSKSCQRISCNSSRLRKRYEWNWGENSAVSQKMPPRIFLLIISVLESGLTCSHVFWHQNLKLRDIIGTPCTMFKETSSQAPSYASPKLWLTHSLTRSLTDGGEV